MKNEDYEDKLVIITKGRKKDSAFIWGMSIFWILWILPTAATTFMAYLSHTEHDTVMFIFWSIWSFFGYLILVVIPLSLSMRNKQESLSVSGDYLIIEKAGALRLKTYRIHKSELDSVNFDHYAGSTDPDILPSLSILRKNQIVLWPILLAQFVHAEDKLKIYSDVVNFLEKNGFKFKKSSPYIQNSTDPGDQTEPKNGEY